jgi:hypothetical protein
MLLQLACMFIVDPAAANFNSSTNTTSTVLRRALPRPTICRAATSSASKSHYPTVVILGRHEGSPFLQQLIIHPSATLTPLCLASWDFEIQIGSL